MTAQRIGTGPCGASGRRTGSVLTAVVLLIASTVVVSAASVAHAEVVPPFPDCIPGTNPGTLVVPPGYPPGTQCLRPNTGVGTLSPRLSTVAWGGTVTFAFGAPDTPTPNTVLWDALIGGVNEHVSGCTGDSLTCTVRFVPGGAWGGLGSNHWWVSSAASGRNTLSFAGVWVTPSMYQVHVEAQRPNGSPVTGVTTGGGVAVRPGADPNLADCLHILFGEYYRPGTGSGDRPWWPTDGLPDCVNARYINESNPTIQPDWAFGLPPGQWDIYLWEASGPPVAGGKARQVTPYTVPRVTVTDADQFVPALLETRPSVGVSVQVLGNQPVAIGHEREVRVTLTASQADAGYVNVTLDPADVGLAVANPAIAEIVAGPEPAPFPGGFQMFSGQTRQFTYRVRALAEGTTDVVSTIRTETDQGVLATKTARGGIDARVVRAMEMRNLQAHPSSLGDGERFVITGNLVNVGNVDINGITLISAVDQSVPGAGDLDTPQPSTIAILAPGASMPVTFGGTLRDNRGVTVHVNSNGAAADNGSPVSTLDRIRVGRAPATLSVRITAPANVDLNPVAGGGVAPADVEVQVRVSNTGSDTVHDVTLSGAPTITITEGDSEVVLEPTGSSPSLSFGSIAPDDPPQTVTFMYRAVAPGAVELRTEARGFDANGQVIETDETSIRVSADPDLIVDLSDVPTEAQVGETVNAVVTITNPSETESVSDVTFAAPSIVDPGGTVVAFPGPDDSGFELAPGASRSVPWRLRWSETGSSRVRFDVTATRSGDEIAGSAATTVEVREQSALQWEMTPRYNGHGFEATTYDDAHPDSWEILLTLDVDGGCGDAELQLEELTPSGPVDVPVRVFDQNECQWHIDREELEPFELRATVRRDDAIVSETTERLEPHDLVVVSIGDSMSSGEGAKDPSLGWSFAQCDRSALAGPAMAALRLEDDGNPSTLDDAHSAVTFVHLACSGASTDTGLLGYFPGTGDQASLGGPLDPQLFSITPIIGERAVDALLMTSGINDIKFEQLIQHCFKNSECGQAPLAGRPVDAVLEDRLDDLPAMYDRLDEWITHLGIDRSNVYLLEYPDPSKDDSGEYCNYAPLDVDGLRSIAIAPDEWEFLEFAMQRPLNARGDEAAAVHGWNRVGGVMSAFRTHGLCSSAPWSNTIEDSILAQFQIDVPLNYYGGFHPNIVGHSMFGNLIYDALIRGGVDAGGGGDGGGSGPTTVASGSTAGDDRIEIANNEFAPGDVVTINPGGATGETRRIDALGSLIFDQPLEFDHGPGEVVVRTSDLPSSIGANRPPVAQADAFIVAPIGPTTLDVLTNDSDPDGDPFYIFAIGGHQYLEPIPGGVGLIWNPPTRTCEPVELGYRIADQRGASSEDARVVLTPDCSALSIDVSDVTAAEGTTATMSATVIGDRGDATLVWDTDADGKFDDGMGSSVLVFTGDGPAAQSISARLADPGGPEVTGTGTLTVYNVDPSGTLLAPSSVVAGSAFVLSVIDIADVAGDPISVEYVCGGVTLGAGSMCTIDVPGPAVVTGILRDDDGGVTELTRSLVVAPPPPPDTSIVSGPSDASWSRSASSEFRFVSTPPGATFECALDGAPSTPCVSPVVFDGLSDGEHTFRVAARGLGGLDPTPATRTWRVDTLAPGVSVATPSAGATFTVGQLVTPAVTCSDLNLESCSNSGIDTTAVGVRSFQATGVDQAGNLTTVAVSYEVRAVVPPPSNEAPQFDLGAPATIPVGATFLRSVTFVDSDGGPWKVSVDSGAGWEPLLHVSKSFVVTRRLTSVGTVTLRVRVCDAAANCTIRQVAVSAATGVTARPVVPFAECANAIGPVRVGVWGYVNPNDWIVRITLGNRNQFAPNPQNRAQATEFLPGTWPGAQTTQPANASLTWRLDGNAASITSSTRRCL